MENPNFWVALSIKFPDPWWQRGGESDTYKTTIIGATKKTTTRKCNEKMVGTQNELFESPNYKLRKDFLLPGSKIKEQIGDSSTS